MEWDLKKDFLEVIREAELVLVGLGEEFDSVVGVQDTDMYEVGKEMLLQSKQSSLLPAWQRLYYDEKSELIRDRLTSLAKLLEDKNYFVVSVATNHSITEIPWREGRLVMPCGSDLHMQCSGECEAHLELLGTEDKVKMEDALSKWRTKLLQGERNCLPDWQGICLKCKNPISLNNIYNEQYDENGYLPNWQIYTKWLQGTVNRKLVVLELGVGMKFPSVIRFPFEKIAYFNQKAKFYRINKNLYHLTEELAQKGVGIADNAIDWLEKLC